MNREIASKALQEHSKKLLNRFYELIEQTTTANGGYNNELEKRVIKYQIMIGYLRRINNIISLELENKISP